MKSSTFRFDLKTLLIIPIVVCVPFAVNQAGTTSVFGQSFLTLGLIVLVLTAGLIVGSLPSVIYYCFRSRRRRHVLLLLLVITLPPTMLRMIWRFNTEIIWAGYDTSAWGILAGWGFPFLQLVMFLFGAWWAIRASSML